MAEQDAENGVGRVERLLRVDEVHPRLKNLWVTADRIVMGNTWILEHPRVVSGSLAMLVALALLWPMSGVIAAIFVLLLTAAVFGLAHLSDRLRQCRREKKLTGALRQLVKGSHVGLPTRDDLSRAFETAARDIEDRLLSSIREKEIRASEAEGRVEECEARVRTAQEAGQDARKRLSVERCQWERERVGDKRKHQVEISSVRGELSSLRSNLVDRKARWSEERESLEREKEESRAELAGVREELESERTRWSEERESLEREKEESQAELAGVREELESQGKEKDEFSAKLQAELQSLRDEYARAHEEWQELRATREQEVDEARKELSSVLSENERRQTVWDSEKKTLEAEHQAQLECQSTELDCVRGELEESKSRENQRQIEVEDTKKDLENQLAHLRENLLANKAEVAQLVEDGERLKAMAESMSLEQVRFFDNVSGRLKGPIQIAGKLAQDLSVTAPEPCEDPQNGAGTKVKEIGKQLSRLDHLVEQIVELCKLESSQWKAVYTDVNARQLIKVNMAEFQELAHSRGIELVEHLPIDLPHIQTDERLLVRTFKEVLSNAVRFTDTGGRIDVRASIISTEDPGQSALELSVSDTGTGIKKDSQERIFQPFEQAEGAPRFKSGESGVGLGLALAKRYIQLLEGRIHVESEPGRGSTFTIVTPVQACVTS